MQLLRSSLHFVDGPDGLISFDVHRTRRRTLAIQVHVDGRIVVRAPQRASLREIRGVVREKRDWIDRKRREFAARSQELDALRREAATTRYYLGRPYALQVVPAEDEREGVRLAGGSLEVSVADLDPDHVDSVLDDWYRERARRELGGRVDLCMERVKSLRVQRPEIRFRKMRTQWGSCSSQGRVTLNTELVKAPWRCIDYVIVHELCHLRELNHSPRYYALLERVMPDWHARREALENLSVCF